LDKSITEVYGDIRVLESDIKINSEKLESVKEAEKMFKKYSIYLQAMHRDGIPALIIRKKLPIINSKINSILQQIVGFKVELDILPNGDIFEYFYYSDDRSDSLPLQFASGAQKFVASIAIKDSLHFISTLTKPSMSIIDEGFGTLGDRLSLEIVNILQYLKNKHKNVIFVTHKNEIKDFADNIIEVSKIKKGIPKEILDSNPEAGVTTLSIS
jgi:DNA repair exonuclease SbcCD ATPase subunit